MKSALLAVKPQALPKLLLPLGAGMALAYRQTGAVEGSALALAVLLAVCAQWAIVLLNDYADCAADRRHAARFPHLMDARVLVEGQWPPSRALLAGLAAALAALLAAAGLWALGRPLAPLFAAAGLALVWAYSFPPLKLNYRGGGEVLEGLGTGVLLPLAGHYFLAGRPEQLHLLAPAMAYGFVGALSSGLKHEPADRANGKKTVCVLLGAASVRRAIWILQMLARLYFAVLFLLGAYGLWAALLGALAPAAPMWAARAAGERADYRDLEALRQYQRHVRRGAHLTAAALIADFILG